MVYLVCLANAAGSQHLSVFTTWYHHNLEISQISSSFACLTNSCWLQMEGLTDDNTALETILSIVQHNANIDRGVRALHLLD